AILGEWARTFEGDPAKALRLHEQAAARFEEAGEESLAAISGVTFVGGDLMLLGAFERAEAELRRAIAALHGQERWVAVIRLVGALARRGAIDEALGMAEEAVREALERAEAGREGAFRWVLAKVRLLQGDLGAAAREAEASLALPPMLPRQ